MPMLPYLGYYLICVGLIMRNKLGFMHLYNRDIWWFCDCLWMHIKNNASEIFHDEKLLEPYYLSCDDIMKGIKW